MHKEGYYSSGEFAKKANVTVRTIRYYDKQNILKPSYVTDTGVRFYTDSDFTRLQQILLLKYLGFSLDDIKGMTIGDSDYNILKNSLHLQLKLIQDKMAQMQLVKNAIEDTIKTIDKDNTIDWSSMLSLIHLTNMESSLKTQYQNAGNISARINLHSLYSQNPQGWFPWIYSQCHLQSGMNVLELGCGDGALWKQNISLLPQNIHLTLSDISDGMLRDARRALGARDSRFSFAAFDCEKIPASSESYDLVIANHVLFYCDNLENVCKEVRRVLKPGGRFLCSTYGNSHMKEISQLVSRFDERIVLSANKLYEKFGRENGAQVLEPWFSRVEWISYEDGLLVSDPEPLISYILSCHGNQNQYLPDRYKDFRALVKKKTENGFHITKDAGAFLCEKVTNLK